MVQEDLQVLAALTRIDVELAELQEELGDLPFHVKMLEKEVRIKQEAADFTQKNIDDVLQTRSNAQIRAQEIYDKERKLTEQQFQVRNNREFDAMTREIDVLKAELREVEKAVAASFITEENLGRVLSGQVEDLHDAQDRLAYSERELFEVSGEHSDEVRKFHAERAILLPKLPTNIAALYTHIKDFHTDVAVSVRRGSCSGCSNSVPPQRIVEMRTFKVMFTCESCGRILFPEEMVIEAQTATQAAT
jgi:uncharacterized protein